VLEIALEDVVGLSELAADLTDEEFTPLDLHILTDGIAVARLLLLHFLKLQGQAELLAISVHVALLHELERLLGEDGGELGDVTVAAPVSVVDAVFELHVTVLLAGDDTEVRVGVLVNADWRLQGLELGKVSRDLHLLHNQALLHLADVFLLNDAHQVGECAVDSVLLEAIALLDALAHEALTTLLGKGRNDVMLDSVDLFCE